MKHLKQTLSLLLTPLLVLSTVIAATGVVGLVALSNWQTKLDK